MTSRRDFISSAVAATAAAYGLGIPRAYENEAEDPAFAELGAKRHATSTPATNEGGEDMNDKAEDPRIRRARLSGPAHITRDATVAVPGAGGAMTILVKGTNEWVCTPGDENKIGDPPMCMNPMGMQWMMDAMQGKPRPTNSAPGMIYMLCGATQRSNTDVTDRTSPAIPIGPHWMITWPFNAAAFGLPTTVRDKGAWVMFSGTPYEYLHVCGTPWDGNEYHEGDSALWTMTYARP
jgi:hypothetical protein